MIHSGPPSDSAVLRPYLKASSITESGLNLEHLQTMPFTPRESSNLDLREGDVVVVEGGSIGRSAYLHYGLPHVHFQNSVNRVRAHTGVDGRFLNYCIIHARASGYFEAVTNQATIRHLTAEKLADMPLVLPSTNDQRLIADYLDHETAQVDALVHDLERLKDTSSERLMSLHNEIFGAPVSPTGLPELLGVLAERDIRAGTSPLKRELLSVSISSGVSPKNSGSGYQSASADLGNYKIVEPNDIIVNRMRAFQGAIGVSRAPGITSPDYAVLKPLRGSNTPYLAELMRSDRFVGEISKRLRGIGNIESSQVRTPRISVHDLLRIPVSMPTTAQQGKLLSTWQSESLEVELALSEVAKAVALAKERRAALINAAVTGQIDVTDRRRGPSEA